MILEIHAMILPIISTFMDWLLEGYITCTDPDHCSRTWDFWPFRYARFYSVHVNKRIQGTDFVCPIGDASPYGRNLDKRKVILARVYSLSSSFPFCW